jgi:hypothetical protein
MVIKAVSKYKKYRKLLEGDITHLVRPDGRNIDAIIHTLGNHTGHSMLVAYNPGPERQSTLLGLPDTLSPYKDIRVIDTDTSKAWNIKPRQDGRFLIDVTIDAGAMRMLELVQ